MLVGQASGGLDWAHVAVAALGSSAIGAIVGGFLTTWLRGQIEREEAWRTRLIEAADDVANALSQADLDFNAILIRDVAESRYTLRGPDGAFAREVVRSLKASLDGVRKANRLLTRVELLYGHDSIVYSKALDAVYGLSGSVRLLEGNSRAQRAVLAVVADHQGDTHQRDELVARDEVAESRYKGLVFQQRLPAQFEPKDDSSVAAWALKLHDAAVDSFHDFVRAAHQASRAKHPGPGRRRV
jgi:hypothetical protein